MDFKKLIKSVLSRGNLQPTEIDWIVDNHIRLYEKAFTSMAYNPAENYEELEQKGDASANAFLVWYFYNRFPQLDCPAGVPVIARLKIVYSSKTTFFKIAKQLGFWQFIRATQNEKDNKEKSLLEDVFEAFVGATQDIFDKRYELGFGFVIVCRILKNLFDDIDISLEYEDLYDAKTRLKEYFDTHKQLGKLITDYNVTTRLLTLYIAQDRQPQTVPLQDLKSVLDKIDTTKNYVNVTLKNKQATVSFQGTGKSGEFLASATAPTKAEAEQKASQIALDKLGVRPTKKLTMVCL